MIACFYPYVCLFYWCLKLPLFYPFDDMYHMTLKTCLIFLFCVMFSSFILSVLYFRVTYGFYKTLICCFCDILWKYRETYLAMGGSGVHKFQLGLKWWASISDNSPNLVPCPSHIFEYLVNTTHMCPIWNIGMHPFHVKWSPKIGQEYN